MTSWPFAKAPDVTKLVLHEDLTECLIMQVTQTDLLAVPQGPRPVS